MFKFNPKFKRESPSDYPYIVEEILQFIIFSREENLSTDSIVDLIFEYCRQTGLSEEFVGDSIIYELKGSYFYPLDLYKILVSGSIVDLIFGH